LGKRRDSTRLWENSSVPYSLIKETGAAKILLGEEIRQNKLVWCAFAGRRLERDIDIADCAGREFNEESGFIWDDLLDEIKKSVSADKTLKIWEKKGLFGLFLLPVPFKENVQQSYLEFKSNIIQKLNSKEEVYNNQNEEQNQENQIITNEDQLESNIILPIVPTQSELTEISEPSPEKDPGTNTPVNSLNLNSENDNNNVEQPTTPPPPKYPQTTRTQRERLLFERRRLKQREDRIAPEKLGKTRLEYFDIYTIVDAVEKHNGCLNPEAPETDKKWLHDYFLDLLKIPMVLTTIKVLPVRLNLRGTGVPFTWK